VSNQDLPLLVTALGWALLHFLWQGTLVALLLAGAHRLLKGLSTNVRYAAACSAMLMMLALPLITMAVIMRFAPPGASIETRPAFAESNEQKLRIAEREQALAPPPTITGANSASSWIAAQQAPTKALLPWLILLWLGGVVFFSLRLIGGWAFARRMKTHGVRPMEDGWRRTLKRLCQQLRIARPVRLLESAMAPVPMTIGWLRPVILIPVGALTGLTQQQLEAIIAHELAHIRRHDYLINLLQAVIETLLFYHPAVWWVSRRIRDERELCCDDLAVAVCGDALTYARALFEMEQIRAASPQLAVAANGGTLMNRIERLVGAPTQRNNRFAGVFACIIVSAVLVSVAIAATILLQPAEAIAAKQDAQAKTGSAQQTKQIRPESPSKKNGSIAAVAARQGSVEEVLIASIETEELETEELIENQVANIVQIPNPHSAPGNPNPNPQPAPNNQNPNPQSNINQNQQTLNSPNPAQRAAAACSLGKAGAVEAIPALIRLLGDDTPIQPFRCWDSGRWSPAREALKQASPGEQAAIALASLGQAAVEPLIVALSIGERSVRRNAAWAIGEIRGGRSADRSAAIDPLIAALGDEDVWIRLAAAASLGEMRPRRATEALLARLSDSEWSVRRTVAWALGEMKTRAGVESLTALLINDEAEGVRRMAAWALGEIRDRAALDALTMALNDRDQRVRATAKWAISEIND
jgi:HEAT repeat protein/beta-lactamase regulating signal transducer with metallopeptidase domain